MVKTIQPKKPRVLKDENNVTQLRPPKAEAISNAPDRESFHYHLGVIIQKRATVDVHRKHLKEARRQAQDAGINLADLDRVIKMREEEPETVAESISRLAQYAAWAGLAPGVQGDLFKDAAPALDAIAKAEDEGYQDGLEGVTAAGDRYDAASDMGQARMRGWNRGQDVLKSRFAANKVPGESVQ